MPNTIGSAIIEVGVDSRGVDAGFAKIDGAVTRTGKTLENLGGQATAGFNKIGEGGGNAAGKVEAATKNMIGAIQRTTAALDSGSKTSAAYYAALANQRGVSLDALKPYLAQLDAVKAKQEAAAKAAGGASGAIGQLGGVAQNAGSQLAGFAKSLVLGAAVGLSIEAFRSKILGVVDSLANLKTISEKTGASVENLSKLGGIAKQSGTDLASVGIALTKLSKGLSGADEETKGAGKALAYLGVSAKDAAGNLKDPAQVFTEIAKSLAKYEDGAGKAAIAQAIFGKAGAEMLPTLKLLAETGDIAAKATTAQATAAREYQRDLIKLEATQQLFFKTIAVELLPTLKDFSSVLLDASKATNITNGAAKDLAKDNSIANWADAGAIGLARVLDVLAILPAAFKGVGLSIASVLADVDVIGKKVALLNVPLTIARVAKGDSPVQELKAAEESALETQKIANAQWEKVWKADGNAFEQALLRKRKLRVTDREIIANMDARDLRLTAGGSSGLAKLNYDSSGAGKAAGAAIAKEISDFDKLNKAIQSKIALANEEIRLGRPLTEIEKEQAVLLRGRIEGTIRLSDAEFKKLQTNLEGLKVIDKVIEQNKELARQEKARASAINDIIAALDKKDLADSDNALAAKDYAQALTDSNALAQIEINTLGQSAAARQIAIEQYKIELDLQKKILEIKGRLGNEVEEAKAISSVTATAAGQKIAVELKATRDEYASIFDSIDKTAHDTFVNVFQSGKGAFDKLKDTLKSGLLDLLYQMTVKKWIFSIGASVGMGAAGSANAGIGGINPADPFSIAGSIGKGNDAIYAGYNNFATSSFGQTLGLSNTSTANFVGPTTDAYAATATTAVSGAGQFIGDALPYIPAILAASQGKWGTAAGTVIGTFLGGPIGGAIGSFIGSFADDFLAGGGPESNTKLTFGGSKNKVTSSTDTGRDRKDGNYVGGAGVNTAFGSFGVQDQFWIDALAEVNRAGLDKFLTGVKATDDKLASYLTSDERTRVINALDKQSTVLSTGAEGSDPSKQYGVAFNERISAILNGVEEGLSKFTDGFAGTGEQLAAEAEAILSVRKNIEDYAKVFGQSVSLSDLAALRKEGEGVGGAVARLVAEFSLTDAIALQLGQDTTKAFGAIGLASSEARDRIVTLAGGMDKLQAAAAGFAQNYLTEAEQLAPIQKQVSDGLAALGLSSITTRDQFKTTVQALDLSTESSAATYIALLNLQSGFAALHPVVATAAEDAAKLAAVTADEAKKRAALDIQIMELTGDKVGALAAQRQIELAAMEDGLRPLQARIYALQDEATATAAAAAIAKQQRSLDIELMTALGNSEGALAATRADALASLDVSLRGTQQAIFDAQDAAAAIAKARESSAAESQRIQQEQAAADQAAQQAYTQRVSTARSNLQTAYNAESSALQGVISKLDSFATSARKLQDTLRGGDLSPLSPNERYASAQAGFSGVVAAARSGDPESLTKLQQFVELSKKSASSFEEYAFDFATVMATLDDSAATAETQATIAKAQLSSLKAQVDVLLNVDKDVLTVADAIRELQDAMLGGLAGVADAVIGQAAAKKQAADIAAGATSKFGFSGGRSYGKDAVSSAYTPPSSGEAQTRYAQFVDTARSWAIDNYDTSGGFADAVSTQVADMIAQIADSGNFSDGQVLNSGKEYAKFLYAQQYGPALKSFAIGTNYVPNDMIAQIHEGEAIVPKAFNPAAMPSLRGGGNARLEALVEQLNNEVEMMRAETQATAGYTASMDRTLRRVVPDGDALATRAAA